MISAHYGMSDVFDNLVISLCKFTTLLTSTDVSNLQCLYIVVLIPYASVQFNLSVYFSSKLCETKLT